MLEDKIYTLEEMRSLGIDTHEYVFMDQPGETTGMLMLKAESRTPSIRMFFSLSDGRKILTPVFRWQLGRGFQNIPTGTVLKLTYAKNSTGQIHLENAEPV
jgi:hypothetical protein